MNRYDKIERLAKIIPGQYCSPMIKGYEDRNGFGVLSYVGNGSPSRLQLIHQAEDVYLRKKLPPTYHVVERIRNQKGETVGIRYALAEQAKKVRKPNVFHILFKLLKISK